VMRWCLGARQIAPASWPGPSEGTSRWQRARGTGRSAGGELLTGVGDWCIRGRLLEALTE